MVKRGDTVTRPPSWRREDRVVERTHLETARTHLRDQMPDEDADLHVLFIGLFRLGRMLERDAQQIVRADGLEVSDHQVLLGLWLNGRDDPLSPTQLSNRVIQTSGGMSKTIQRLRTAGLVDLGPDPASRRGRLVRLTDHGAKIAERHYRDRFASWRDQLERATDGNARPHAEFVWDLIVDFSTAHGRDATSTDREAP
jgi:DNA-binding MarR family transcriptional regulator